jgi:hypothetical protein
MQICDAYSDNVDENIFQLHNSPSNQNADILTFSRTLIITKYGVANA